MAGAVIARGGGLAVGRHSDGRGERRVHLTGCCFGGARPCSAAPARGSIASVVERTRETADAETALNVGMAAERTWLAWWRTALVATAGGPAGGGRVAPRLPAPPAPH